MGTVKGVNRTLADTPTIANRTKPGLFDARLKVTYDSYEAVALALGSIIEMGNKLPIGAFVAEVILDTDNLGNNTTLKVGDYEDDARYIPLTDHGAAALVTRMNAIDGRMYEIDETTPGATSTDRQIIITTAAGEAGGTIKLLVFYTIN